MLAIQSLMPESEHFSLDELERLVGNLEVGVYDGQLRVAPGAKPGPLAKFFELKPFDVLSGADCRGVKLP